MEPFGLLNLLKSLLPQAENPTQNPNENPNGNGNGLDDGANSTKAENDPALSPNKEKNAPQNFADTPPQNAFLDFVNRHDERKKQIKKP